jgi:hypothetical protein
VRLAARALPLLAILALAGCGGGGGASTSTAATAPGQAAHPHSHQGEAPSPAAGARRQGSAQFRTPGGDNSIQEYGTEAGRAELREAAAALHGFLDARLALRWARACSYLGASVRHSLEALSAGGSKKARTGCAGALAALAASIPRAALAEAAVADARALRSKGPHGFLLYYGAHHAPYGIPVVREGGAWLVGALAGVPLG